tara:strand:+ start:1087 stop:1845 length:759 start_codon:yes stop_codon:yes gene_type:complete
MAQTTLDQRMLGVGTSLTDHTITASDVITFADVGDSNLTKRDTVQGVLDLAGGAYSVITSGTATNASDVEFTSMTHDIHVLDLWCVETASTTAIELHFSADNGSSYLSAQYDNYFVQMYAKGGGTSAQGARYGADNTSDYGIGQLYTQGGNNNVELSLVGAAARTSSEQDPMSNNSTGSAMMTITFDRNKDGAHIPYGHAICSWEPAGYAPAIGLTGFKCNLSAGNDIDAMKVIPATGNFDKLKYRLIGYSI